MNEASNTGVFNFKDAKFVNVLLTKDFVCHLTLRYGEQEKPKEVSLRNIEKEYLTVYIDGEPRGNFLTRLFEEFAEVSVSETLITWSTEIKGDISELMRIDPSHTGNVVLTFDVCTGVTTVEYGEVKSSPMSLMIFETQMNLIEGDDEPVLAAAPYANGAGRFWNQDTKTKSFRVPLSLPTVCHVVENKAAVNYMCDIKVLYEQENKDNTEVCIDFMSNLQKAAENPTEIPDIEAGFVNVRVAKSSLTFARKIMESGKYVSADALSDLQEKEKLVVVIDYRTALISVRTLIPSCRYSTTRFEFVVQKDTAWTTPEVIVALDEFLTPLIHEEMKKRPAMPKRKRLADIRSEEEEEEEKEKESIVVSKKSRSVAIEAADAAASLVAISKEGKQKEDAEETDSETEEKEAEKSPLTMKSKEPAKKVKRKKESKESKEGTEKKKKKKKQAEPKEGKEAKEEKKEKKKKKQEGKEEKKPDKPKVKKTASKSHREEKKSDLSKKKKSKSKSKGDKVVHSFVLHSEKREEIKRRAAKIMEGKTGFQRELLDLTFDVNGEYECPIWGCPSKQACMNVGLCAVCDEYVGNIHCHNTVAPAFVWINPNMGVDVEVEYYNAICDGTFVKSLDLYFKNILGLDTKTFNMEYVLGHYVFYEHEVGDGQSHYTPVPITVTMGICREKMRARQGKLEQKLDADPKFYSDAKIYNDYKVLCSSVFCEHCSAAHVKVSHLLKPAAFKRLKFNGYKECHQFVDRSWRDSSIDAVDETRYLPTYDSDRFKKSVAYMEKLDKKEQKK